MRRHPDTNGTQPGAPASTRVPASASAPSSASASAPPATPRALHLVERLAAELSAASVAYCHWKSNEAITRSHTGENDLDLLVARNDAGRFARVMADLGFRAARPPTDRQVPGILDYYGRDAPSGRIVHVHAHYQLALGDDMTKNVHLPVEAAYVRSATRDGLLPLPAPEFELVLFVLRMVLKHSTWDAQLDRKGRLTASERRELAYLRHRADADAVQRLVAQHLPFIGRDLFSACALAAAERTGRVTRAVTATRLAWALRNHSRRAEVVDMPLRMWRRRLRRVQARLPWHSGKRRLDNGGLLIAVAGGDGSGKSTAVDMLTEQLGRTFVTRRFHMGKPPWSRLTRLVKRPLRRLRGYGLLRATTLPAWHDFGGRSPGLGYMVWHLLTARDRALEYRRARRAVARGEIAVCDRFPLPQLRLMDGPRGGPVLAGRSGPLTRWLAQREAAYYRGMLEPDLLVVLRVPPEVAVARRAGTADDAAADAVRRRAGEVFETAWEGTGAVVIDASRPAEQVHDQIMQVVWAAL